MQNSCAQTFVAWRFGALVPLALSFCFFFFFFFWLQHCGRCSSTARCAIVHGGACRHVDHGCAHRRAGPPRARRRSVVVPPVRPRQQPLDLQRRAARHAEAVVDGVRRPTVEVWQRRLQAGLRVALVSVLAQLSGVQHRRDHFSHAHAHRGRCAQERRCCVQSRVATRGVCVAVYTLFAHLRAPAFKLRHSDLHAGHDGSAHQRRWRPSNDCEPHTHQPRRVPCTDQQRAALVWSTADADAVRVVAVHRAAVALFWMCVCAGAPSVLTRASTAPTGSGSVPIKWWIYAVAAGGALLLAVAVVASFVCVCRKRRARASNESFMSADVFLNEVNTPRKTHAYENPAVGHVCKSCSAALVPDAVFVCLRPQMIALTSSKSMTSFPQCPRRSRHDRQLPTTLDWPRTMTTMPGQSFSDP